MGLDQYLIRTTKRRIVAKLRYEDLAWEYYAQTNRLLEKPRWRHVIDSLPETPGGMLDLSNATPEQKRQVAKARAACRRVAKRLGIDLEDGGNSPVFVPSSWGLTDEDAEERLAYWRKDWDLHQYVIDNFWGNKEDDNLVEVFLTKENLKKIVADGHEEGFKDAIDRWDDDHVVFYLPWY